MGPSSQHLSKSFRGQASVPLQARQVPQGPLKPGQQEILVGAARMTRVWDPEPGLKERRFWGP